MRSYRRRVIPGPTITSEVSLDVVLRDGVRRILACRPPVARFDFDAACNIRVSTGQAARIVCVLREAIINSIDYAHPTGVPGRMVVSSVRQPDGAIRIEITDDGVGLPEGFDPAHDGSGGFRTMRRVSAELGAVLSVRSSCLGLDIALILPASNRQAREAP